MNEYMNHSIEMNASLIHQLIHQHNLVYFYPNLLHVLSNLISSVFTFIWIHSRTQTLNHSYSHYGFVVTNA